MMMRSRAFKGGIFGFRESGLPMGKWNRILDALGGIVGGVEE